MRAVKTVSASFIDAVKQASNVGSLDPQNIVSEEYVTVHGYGVVSKERAQKEADASVKEAQKHARAGNHGGAAYHYERAAMFHKAIHGHKKTYDPVVTDDETPDTIKK